MSMLADRKIKQKWALNPRGKEWSEDSSKFGQKMLEKMGWSKGKGLGAQENGITEHIKISHKNDSKGIGYADRNDQWTEHSDSFNALLQQLSGGDTENGKIEGEIVPKMSLVEKSESSRARVHYRKFTRGKDLTRCSEKDLANIFGRKTLKINPETSEKFTPTKLDSPNVSNEINGGSMFDYFKKKLPNFGKSNGYTVGSNGVLTKNTVDSDLEQVGFGFKRKSEDGATKTPKKLRLDSGMSNPAFDPLTLNPVDVEKHVLNTITEEDETENENPPVQKPKKKKSLEKVNLEATFTVEKSPETPKLKRKKTKILEEEVNPSFEPALQESPEPQDNNVFEVKRKKKKKKTKDDSLETSELRKEKKKNKKEDSVISQSGDLEVNPFEVKRKKKKKSATQNVDEMSFACDNPTFNPEINQESCNNNVLEVKRAKKNETLKTEENPAFLDQSQGQEESNLEFDLMLNVTTTPQANSTLLPPGSKKKKQSAVKRRKSVRFSDVTEERIIPSDDNQLRQEFLDINNKVLSLQNKIDECEAEVENDLNEARILGDFPVVGEVGNDPDGDNEKLPEGTRLKFKYATFGKSPNWGNRNANSMSKCSYKHLIKGDIVLGFQNTNLHEIRGYGRQQ